MVAMLPSGERQPSPTSTAPSACAALRTAMGYRTPRGGARVFRAGACFALIGAAKPALASESGPTARAPDGLPGLYRVGVPVIGPTTGATTGALGFGRFEAFGGRTGASERACATLSAAWTPLDSVDVGLRIDGWYDHHPDDDQGADHVATGVPSMRARWRWELTQDWRAGLELGVALPGREAPSVTLEAITPEARVLSSWSLGPAVLSGYGGFRLDRSAETVDTLAQIRLGDRLSLGASELNAVLLGVGVQLPVGGAAPFGEVTSDVFVGDGAPPMTRSPWRAALGIRVPVAERWWIAGVGDVLLTKRVTGDEVLLAAPPRWTVAGWVTWEWGAPIASIAPATPKPTPVEKPGKPREAASIIGATELPRVVVQGTVVGESGTPIAGAMVTMTMQDKVIETSTDATGGFSVHGLPKGQLTIEVQAEGYEPYRETRSSGGPSVAVTLATAVPRGELRGTVLGAAGAAIRARIRVEGLGAAVETDDKGQFRLEVPPGAYFVIVESDGFVPQRRRLEVANRGVTIFDIHLMKR